ncbi:DUF4886 domain-containing protein [Dysgonomonas sp. 25]|uniref:DUF4886 domain-containing protein n=1 Tax=Dysgonomonas sp. 25 TaxID=2302933 RepID=UPI0013D318BF|nr:DUF4886 domain-containing protein [Dysgonomonas sp. 25]NDV67382.1 DUF4886 domain-containing protein [Dysgonomonas sp. 25]
MKKLEQTIKTLVLLLLVTMSTGMISCSSDDDKEPLVPEEYVTLDKESITLEVGEEDILIPTFSSEAVSQKSFIWTAVPTDIVSIFINQDNSIKVTALKKGNVEIKIEAEDHSVSATCQVQVVHNPQDVVRILGIGNSFTDDAMQDYLSNLAAGGGKKLVVARLTIGGAELDDHLDRAKHDSPVYQYWKRDEAGNVVGAGGKTVKEILQSEEWDYVSFQQQSWLSGQEKSYYSIPQLVKYAKDKSISSKTEYAILQTWSFAYDYGYSDYDYYKNNQLVMLDSLTNAAYKASELVTPNLLVIPAGTAIQNGRTSVVGDNFCRDGYHLDVNIGRFTVACTLYETIFGDIEENPYKPAHISDIHAEIAKNAARLAVAKPKEVTKMVDYQ